MAAGAWRDPAAMPDVPQRGLAQILERVTNIAMGTEIDKITEFEEIDCRHPEGIEGLERAGLLD